MAVLASLWLKISRRNLSETRRGIVGMSLKMSLEARVAVHRSLPSRTRPFPNNSYGRALSARSGRSGGPSSSKFHVVTSVKFDGHQFIWSSRRLSRQSSPHRGRCRLAPSPFRRNADRPKVNYLRLFPETRCSMIALDDHQSCSHTVPPTPKGSLGVVLSLIHI